MGYPLLKAKLKAENETQADLAILLGASRSRTNAKINRKGRADFTLDEVRAIKRHYNLTPDELDHIFFDLQLS